MSETLFISDLHLAPERGATVELFLDFLGGRARESEALFILGDLFDAWIGDDDDQAPYPAIRAALKRLSASGTRCALMRGNRDFLIGRRFARETGCRLLRDPCRVELGGRPTLLMHGDLLCTDDVAYQRFRRRVRNPLVIRLFLLKSRARRRAIAEEYRRRSGAATADKTHDIMDVNQGKVEELMRRFGVRQLIHGHTHRPADHVFRLGGEDVKRLVLAQWQTQRGEVLVASGGALRREAVTPS